MIGRLIKGMKESIRSFWQLTNIVPLFFQSLQRGKKSSGNIKQRGTGLLAKPGRIIINDKSHLLVAIGRRTQPEPLFDQKRKPLNTLVNRLNLAILQSAENNRAYCSIHFRNSVGEGNLHRRDTELLPRFKSLGQQRLSNNVGNIKFCHNLMTRLSGSSRFGRSCRTTNKTEAHHIDQKINILLCQPVTHQHMAFNPHHKRGENMNPLLFKHTNSIVDIGLFLQQMFAEKQKTDFLPFVKINSPLFHPVFIALDIGEICRSIRMVEPHVRDINNCTDNNLLIKVFAKNQPEHIGDIVCGRLHPVGVNHQPVLEILRLFGHKRQNGAHDFHELHIAVESILIAPLHQHLRHFFDHVGHAGLAVANRIIPNLGQCHGFRHGLKNKDGLFIGAQIKLLFKPVDLLFEVDHAHEDTISILNCCCSFRILFFQVDITQLGQFGFA